MRRPLHLATFLVASAALAPACLLDAGPFQAGTGGAGGEGGGTGGSGNTATTGNTTSTSTGGGGNGGTGGVASVCGDGAITGDEQCDDDNTRDGDGCAPDCTIEPEWSCTGEPSVCAKTCSDGKVDENSGEECDDGNVTVGDGCNQGCQIEEGYACAGEPSVCMKTCGNSVLEPDEQCDDANDTPGDGCDATCQREPGWGCDNDPLPSVCFAICGDGVIVLGEEGCDDGDTDGTSGCDEACAAPVDGWACDDETGGPTSCSPICGDGKVVAAEACDDGNEGSGDGCSATCTLESTCGNNIVEPAEECDGDAVGLDECDANCKLLDPTLGVCKDSILIPTGSTVTATGAVETTYQGNSDPAAGGASLLTTQVLSPAGCQSDYNNPVLHRYQTGNRPSFLTLELLDVSGFDNTQLWVYRDCPRKSDYEGCDDDSAADGKHSKFTTGYIPAKSTLFIVVSGEGGGGGGDKGVYSLKIIEQPVELFYHEDFSAVTMPGVQDLVPGLTEMTTGDGAWKSCLPALGNPCYSTDPPSHSGGAFGFAFGETATQTTARVLTPSLDLTGLTAARASFAYRLTDGIGATETAKAEALDNGNPSPGAANYTAPASGRAVVPVEASATARVRFTFDDGASATAGNFTVDDIRVYGY